MEVHFKPFLEVFQNKFSRFSAPFGYFGFQQDSSISVEESKEFLKQNAAAVEVWQTLEKQSTDDFLQNLPVAVFEKQYFSSGKMLRFVPVFDLDLETSFSGEDSSCEILITLTHAEGDAFLFSIAGSGVSEKLW